MLGILAPLFKRSARAETTRRSVAPIAAPTSIESRIEARTLCDALDRAMELGLWDHADRLAASAASLATMHASLCERVTRLMLTQNQPEIALGVLASCRETTASLRLLRCACLVQSGRRNQAHSDLLRWSRKSAAPIDARLMLALLEWDAGDFHAAALTLVRNLKHLEDPRSLELLVLIATRQGRFDQAQRWAERLRACAAHTDNERAARHLCHSLQIQLPTVAHTPTAEQIGTLSLEIISAEQAIPAIVRAQELEPDSDGAALLLAAIERALPELVDRSSAEDAAIRLQAIISDAGNWAREMRDEADFIESTDSAGEPESDVIGRIGMSGDALSERAAMEEAA